MSLIKSISGIRGTIGGKAGDGLNPLDIVKFTAAYATFIRKNTPVKTNKIVVGRDARISGEMVKHTVIGTLMGMGFDVVNIGLATTPTTEIAVTMEKACGGIILTASHNPKQWNALKLLNEKGEFLNAAEGQEVLNIAAAEAFDFADVDHLGRLYENNTYTQKHIESVLALDLVDVEAIRSAGFKVAIDCVNSVGGIVIPELLKALGVKDVIELNCTPDGKFPHNPEPLPENLTQIAGVMKEGKADVGFVVDPDVDRLAIVCENGGLISGVACAIKSLNPNIKVYGVQAEGAPSMVESIKNGEPVHLDSVSTIADGIQVKEPGEHTFEYVKKYVDDIVTVSDDEISSAILKLIESQKMIAEGAGAAPLAAVMFNKLPVKGKKVVCVVSGGNIDVTILSRVIKRGLLMTGRQQTFCVELQDKPGQLVAVSNIIAEKGANVISIHHERGGEGTDVNGCYLRVVLETRDFAQIKEIRDALVDAGFKLV